MLVVLALAVLAGLAGLVAVLAGPTLVPGEATRAMSPDETAIRQLVTDFLEAEENADVDRVAASLCPEDSQQYLDTVYVDEESGPLDDPVEVTVGFSEVRIEEPYAAIRYTLAGVDGEGVLYAQRFDDRWLLCRDAEYAMQDAEATDAAGPTG